MMELAPRVFIETEYSSVTVGAIQTTDGWVCIDTPPYPRDARAWRAALESISDAPIHYLINTDAHRDRILGNAWFEAPVVAHEAAAQRMLALKGPFISQAAEELSSNDNELVEIASLRFVPPQISFSSSLVLYCGEREISLYHRPGATFGNSWVVLPEEKVLFAGDSVIPNQHPPMTEGDTKAWLSTLVELQQDHYAGWTLVPGRGEPVDASSLTLLVEYLRTVRRRVAGLCQSGRPRAELGGLVGELMAAFPFETNRRDEVQRRIRAGLEAVYEEIRASDCAADEG